MVTLTISQLQLLPWRYPGLSHGAIDDVPLNPFAVWASKRSQVLAPHARLNRGQPHWRTASRALRTLILCVEHMLLPLVRCLTVQTHAGAKHEVVLFCLSRLRGRS